MAKRINEPGSEGRVSAVPNVTFSNSEAEDLRQLSGSLHHYSMKVQDNLDTQAKIDSHRQGLIDGQNGELNKDLLYAPSIRGRAYTASATQAFGQRLELDMRRQIQKVEELHPGEPDVIREKLDAYMKGRAGELPEEMRGFFEGKATIMSDSAISRQNKVQIQKQRKQADADALILHEQRMVEAGELGRGMFSNFEDNRKAATNGLVSLLEDVKQGYDSIFEDARGNKVPMHDPRKKALALTDLLRTARTSAVRGWFDEKTDKAQALKDFRDGKYDPVVLGEDGEPLVLDTVMGEDGEEDIILDLSLTENERRAAINYMESEIARERAVKNQQVTALRGNAKEATNMMEKGLNPGTETINRLKAQASALGDKELVEDIKVAEILQGEFEADLRATPANLQAQLNHEEAILNNRDPKEGVSPIEAKVIEQRRELLNTKKAELAKDPISYGTKANIIQASPLLFSAQESVDLPNGKKIKPVDTMKKRVADALTVAKHFGTPPRFFTDEERATLSETLGDENISPTDVLGILGTVNAGFGDFADEALSELASDEPVFAHLAGLQSIQASASTLLDEAKGILLMKGGTNVISPGSNDVRSVTAEVLGSSFASSEFTQQNVILGAEAIYTARAVKQGLQGDVFDEDLWKRSLQEAARAQFVKGEQFGGITEFNDFQVVIPRSIRAERFQDVINNLNQEDLNAAIENGPAFFTDSKGKKKSLDLQALLANGASLHAIDDGRYIISQGKPGDEDERFVRGESDLSSETGAVRNGFVVLNLNKIQDRIRAVDDQVNKPLLDQVMDGFGKIKDEVGVELGKIKDDVNLIFQASPEGGKE